MNFTKEGIEAIFKAGEALGFAKRAGQPTIGLTFDEQYEQLVRNCSIPLVVGSDEWKADLHAKTQEIKKPKNTKKVRL